MTRSLQVLAEGADLDLGEPQPVPEHAGIWFWPMGGRRLVDIDPAALAVHGAEPFVAYHATSILGLGAILRSHKLPPGGGCGQAVLAWESLGAAYASWLFCGLVIKLRCHGVKRNYYTVYKTSPEPRGGNLAGGRLRTGGDCPSRP